MRPNARPLCRAGLGLVLLLLSVEWCGWELEIHTLHQPMAGTPPMVPWTIVLLTTLSVAAFVLFRPEEWAWVMGKALGVSVLVAVAAFGFEWFAGVEPTILDRWWPGDLLVREGVRHGGRPSPHVLIAVGGYGLAIISYGRRGRAGVWLPQVAALSGFFCPMMALLGYLYHLTALRRVPPLPSIGMSLPSAIGLLLVGVALFSLHRKRGMFGLFCSEAFGGVLIRRFFALVVLAPILLGWFLYRGQTLSGAKLQWFTAFAALLLSVSYAGLLIWIGHLADAHEQAMVASAKERDRLIAELRDSMAEIIHLRSQLITVCAWSSRIKNHGRWMSLEEFLDKQLHLRISHGISDEALSELLTTVERDEWERQEASRDHGEE